MNIIITNSGGVPIYEQIAAQIKGLILGGELHEGDALPSMRALAQDLRVSVITTKRAYEILEIEEHLGKAADIARQSGVTKEELTEILAMFYE